MYSEVNISGDSIFFYFHISCVPVGTCSLNLWFHRGTGGCYDSVFFTSHSIDRGMEKPVGKIIAIGGSEDKGESWEVNDITEESLHFFELGILRRILNELKGADSVIEVVTTASRIPVEVGAVYREAFHKLGCRNVGIIDVRDAAQACDPQYEERIGRADGVLFSGGDQLRLVKIFQGTKFIEIVKHRYRNEPFMIAGTSAGAMAMGDAMIFRGSSSEALLKGELKITAGFGFVPDVIIDTHFVRRNRFGRLIQSVAYHPTNIGFGLGEDTAIIMTEGNKLETIGSGLVVVVDGHEIKSTDMAHAPHGRPITLEHVVLHILASRSCFHLDDRRVHYQSSAG